MCLSFSKIVFQFLSVVVYDVAMAGFQWNVEQPSFFYLGELRTYHKPDKYPRNRCENQGQRNNLPALQQAFSK